MSTSLEPDLLQQAAAWRTRLTEAPEEYAEQFRAWLALDPRNSEAWHSVQTPWLLLGEHAASPALIRLRRTALDHAHDAERRSRGLLKRHRFPRVAAAAAAILALAMTSLLIWQANRFDIYRTGAGERRVVTLIDGSEIALDSQSEVQVRYTKRSRELVLLKGQARFAVAHDILRPFSVTANGHEVVATGTAFNVDLLGSDLLVTLIEGHVVVLREGAQTASSAPASERSALNVDSAVSPAASNLDPGLSSRISLDAGEQLVISPRTAPRVTRVNVERATAWESGQLVFENEPLSSVVARVSRYGAQPLVIGDEQTSNLRISGVFHEGDVTGFVSTIVSYLPVRAQQGRDGATHLSAKAGTSDR
jgi:transmembrane sensor